MEVKFNVKKSFGYFLFLGVFLSASLLLVGAYGGDNPPVMGHSANEIEGVAGKAVLYDTPYPVTNSIFSGTGVIEAGNGIPLGTKEILLRGNVVYISGGSPGEVPGYQIKHTTQISWKKLVWPSGYGISGGGYAIDNSAWIPLGPDGKLQWELYVPVSTGQTQGSTLTILGHRL